MKKLLMVIAASFSLLAGSAVAQENAGGMGAGESASGDISSTTIAASVFGGTIALAVLLNNKGSMKVHESGGGGGATAHCNGDDPLVDGMCVGHEVNVVVSGTGANAVTSTVVNTVYYPPTVS